MFSNLEVLLLGSGAQNGSIPQFTGYAFVGSDLIVGEVGHQKWVQSGGQPVAGHQDGCYMTVYPVDVGFEVAADYKGYCKIYYYSSGMNWAVSNSFASLVNYAREHGWPVSPNVAILDTWDIGGAFWQQLPTFETAAFEISLVPRRGILRGSCERGLEVVFELATYESSDRLSYSTALAHFIETWVGRYGTCLRGEDAQMSLELTGGMDSRVALAVALGYRQHFGGDFDRQFNATSSIDHPLDLDCATKISENYSLRLNNRWQHAPYGADRLSSFERWQQFALGVYGPIYFPPATTVVNRFEVGGHGGEGHRAYWDYESPGALLERHHSELEKRGNLAYLRTAFATTEEALQAHYPSIPPIMRHYREFRDRIHGGLHAQHRLRLQPLSSEILYEATRHLDGDALARGQMLYDVVAQCSPNLLTMPYDDDRKKPSDEVLSNLLRPLEISPVLGTKYGSNEPSQRAQDAPEPWGALVDVATDASDRIDVELVGAESLSEARETLKVIKEGGRLAHPRLARTIHRVVLADFVSR